MKHPEFEDCLKRKKIAKFSGAKQLAAREFKTAVGDLKSARESYDSGNSKWATIQAYYAMFHAGRSLLYSRGYREKSHYCLVVALKALFVAAGKLDVALVEALQMAKALRENADYENEFSREAAKELIAKAEQFMATANPVIKKGP